MKQSYVAEWLAIALLVTAGIAFQEGADIACAITMIGSGFLWAFARSTEP